MIKTVKVEDLVKYARFCVRMSESDILSETTKRNYRIRAEGIRSFLAEEDADRNYKLNTGKDTEWCKYFDRAWEEYNNMIFE